MAQQVMNLPAMLETQVQSLCREDPPKKKWQPIAVFLPGRFHGQRNLAGSSPWGQKRDRHDSVTKQQLFQYYQWEVETSKLNLIE